jgi:transcriptional regulator with XRE-family HTH domain
MVRRSRCELVRCVPGRQMKSFTKTDPKPIRDIAYYQQRYRNRVFSKLVSFITEQAQRQHLTQKDIAERIRKDPASISRLLSSPSNLTLDTISDLLLAFDAEAEPPEIVQFKDRRPANYVHPLIAQALNIAPQAPPAKTESTAAGIKALKGAGPDLKIEFNVRAG